MLHYSNDNEIDPGVVKDVTSTILTSAADFFQARFDQDAVVPISVIIEILQKAADITIKEL